MSGSSDVLKLSRRDFLRHGLVAGAGLTLGFRLQPANAISAALDGGEGERFAPNAFVRIGTDGTVTVVVKHIEFGQGTFTGLPTVLADELDADLDRVVVEPAPADASRYANTAWGGSQGTGGSSSMRNSFTQLRRAGATARAMLVAAAAAAWQVRPGEVSVARGVLEHAASGRRADFGEFALAAAELPVPKNVSLKDPGDFVYIGRDVPRVDRVAKSDGTAIYTQDIRLPGMLTALVAHPPRFGARVRDFDASAALAVAGVKKVFQIETGVAVVAANFWAAKQGRDALSVEWDERDAFTRGTDDIFAEYRRLAAQPGLVAADRGDAAAALAAADEVIESEFTFPFLAHASMEPMNCVARVADGRCEMWYGVQGQSRDQRNVAAALGLPADKVTLNMLYAGGSFGRRSNTVSDYPVEAARIAAAMGDGTPVKLVWTREDDMRAGSFRPAYVHRVRGALDGDGGIAAWEQRIVGQSILAGAGFGPGPDKPDPTSIEGAHNLPYAMPNLRVDSHQPALGVPVLWWRSVGHTHTAFSTEVFFDELAHAAGRDPLEMRLALLADDPRRRGVL
ncbi:MAG: molybdopterin cofactor-binding domain-containing protein, partial [Gammaproteobacteria bacterium]